MAWSSPCARRSTRSSSVEVRHEVSRHRHPPRLCRGRTALTATRVSTSMVAVASAASDLEHRDRTGDGDVQRPEPALLRGSDTSPSQCGPGRPWRSPVLGPQHEPDRTARGGSRSTGPGLRLVVEAHDPQPGLSGLVDGPPEVPDPGDRHDLGRSGRHPADGRGHAGGSAGGHDDPVEPGTVGRSQQRAEVVGVGHAVEEQQRGAVDLEQALERRVAVAAGDRDDPLVVRASASLSSSVRGTTPTGTEAASARLRISARIPMAPTPSAMRMRSDRPPDLSSSRTGRRPATKPRRSRCRPSDQTVRGTAEHASEAPPACPRSSRRAR